MTASSGVLFTRARRAWPAGLLATLVISGFAYVAPKGDRNALVETTIWSLLVLTAFAGWGSLVKHLVAREQRVDLGLRVAWGASAACAIGGTLMVVAAMTRTAALALVDLGLILALAELFREQRALRGALAFAGRFARREPKLAVVALALSGLVALAYLGGVANWHVNPYDDDIAYTPFVHRLLGTGTFIEPFSIRRLSALGGQTFFIALVSIRASALQVLTFDRSMSILMIALLLVGHRDQGRRVSPLFLAIATVFVITTPCMAINSASSYSGVAFFLALYRTLAWVERAPRAPWKNAVVLALVSAALCTLRQSYLPIPAVMLAASYAGVVFDTRRLNAVAREALLVAGLTLVALLPWFFVSWQSNRTFLYPLIAGNSNPAMAMRGASTNLTSELVLMLTTVQEGLKVTALGAILFGVAFVREGRGRRPLGTFIAANVFGFVMLVHGLTASDAPNVGRYAFAGVVAMVLAILLVAGTRRDVLRETRSKVFYALVLYGSLDALVSARATTTATFRGAIRNVASAYISRPRSENTPPEAALYTNLQASVPPGSRSS